MTVSGVRNLTDFPSEIRFLIKVEEISIMGISIVEQGAGKLAATFDKLEPGLLNIIGSHIFANEP